MGLAIPFHESRLYNRISPRMKDFEINAAHKRKSNKKKMSKD